MTFNKYTELIKKDNEVCYDIDNYLTGEKMKRYDNVEKLLEDAENVIGKYRSFVCSIIDKIDIENCIRK